MLSGTVPVSGKVESAISRLQRRLVAIERILGGASRLCADSLNEKVGNLGEDRPGGYQSARKAAGNLHCSRVIRIARVYQGE